MIGKNSEPSRDYAGTKNEEVIISQTKLLIMLSLKDFKAFEVNNSIQVTGGEYTSHTSGHDMIYTGSDGNIHMDVNGNDAGCQCPDGRTYSPACC